MSSLKTYKKVKAYSARFTRGGMRLFVCMKFYILFKEREIAMKTKLKSKIVSALLVCMLVVGFVPTTVFAADTATVEINGQQLEDGVPVQCGEGTAVLDTQNKTLTQNNATLTETNDSSVIRVTTGELKIILNGENKIISNDKRPFYGQYADITIQGTQADSLTVETDSDGIQADQGNLTVDGCNIHVTSTAWGGLMCWDGTLAIKNQANITVDSYENPIVGSNGISITDSTVNATSNRDGTNVINSNGDISIDNSNVTATGTSEEAYPSIYAAGNINVTNKSDVTATSEGMRGIFTDSNMTVNDSTVAATATTQEGMVVVGTLNLTNSRLAASSKPDDIIPAIVTKSFNITNSEVTANGGLDLFDWNSGETDGISFSITPGNEKLMEFKVDGNNWDGSAAIHFKEGSQSPYDTVINFSADEMNWLGAYRYIYIGEHIHTGGTANCEMPAICEDCGRQYGNSNPDYHQYIVKVKEKEATCTEEGYTGDKVCKVCGEIVEKGKVTAKTAHNFKDGKCTVCKAADPDYVSVEPTASDKGNTNSPQTGDSANIVLWLVVMLAAGASLTITAFLTKRKNKAGK